MDEAADGSLAAFFKTLRRSPVRWVVLVHAVLLGAVISLLTVFPEQEMLWRLDAMLVLTQVALLLIWMTLDRNRPPGVGRALGVTTILLFIQLAHTPTVSDPDFISGLVCTWPCIFIFLGVLALPLTLAESRGVMIMRFAPGSMPPPRRLQFSIRTVLIGAVCVAVLFSLKGLLDFLEEWPLSIGVDFALVIFIMVIVAVAIYLSIPLVAVWTMLTPGRILPRLATAVVGWGLGGMLIFHYTQTDGNSMQIESTIPVTATAGAIPILLATLYTLRRMGYRAVQVGRDDWGFLDEPDAGSPFAPEKEEGCHDPPT